MSGEAAVGAVGDDHFVGRTLVAPTLEVWGTDDQKARYLPGITGRTERWCQLYSEPGAGSDLAGLATRAEQRDGTWHVTGQKVWSTLAHIADRGLLLARTDPDAPRHAGITCFLLDMRQPGVVVRPLRQLTGRADEFNEVFLDGALIDDDDRLGPAGAGWKVAQTTLTTERGMLSGGGSAGPTRVERLVAAARDGGRWEDPLVRQELVDLLIGERVLEVTKRRIAAELRLGNVPPAAAVTKLARSSLSRRIEDTACRLLGPHATAWQALDDEGAITVERFYLVQRDTIVGGTSDIQRNIIGDRALGLPREPDPFRNLPWSRTPR